jgi:hypothetical protein
MDMTYSNMAMRGKKEIQHTFWLGNPLEREIVGEISIDRNMVLELILEKKTYAYIYIYIHTPYISYRTSTNTAQ